MYVLLLIFSEKRWLIAPAFAVIFIVTGILPLKSAFGAINWNVLLMLAGTMATVELFIQSKMPARMAEKLLKVTPNVQWAVVALSLFSGLISAFVDNVATVLMVAPVGLAVARKIKTNPIPVIIAIAVSSNLQGAATLVGDTTSILLGNYAGMGFNDFFWFKGRLGICFAVEAGALMGLICCGLAVIGIIYEVLRRHEGKIAGSTLKAVDYQTLILLAGLFMVIEGMTEAGVIERIAELFVKIGGGSIALTYVLIVGVSVLLSAFIDNIPYVATMLPVVTGISALMGHEPYLLAFGLLIGATLGGNITPIGASANIAGIGILQKEGYKVSTKDFIRIGIPFTIVAAVTGAAVVWLVWA